MCIQKDVREILVASKRVSEGMLRLEIWNLSNLNLAYKKGTRKIPYGLRDRGVIIGNTDKTAVLPQYSDSLTLSQLRGPDYDPPP